MCVNLQDWDAVLSLVGDTLERSLLPMSDAARDLATTGETATVDTVEDTSGVDADEDDFGVPPLFRKG